MKYWAIRGSDANLLVVLWNYFISILAGQLTPSFGVVPPGSAVFCVIPPTCDLQLDCLTVHCFGLCLFCKV
jgi:hypothetical protein